MMIPKPKKVKKRKNTKRVFFMLKTEPAICV